jgi:CRP/FNR family transcriptional regulator, anaerobic regulatory protein
MSTAAAISQHRDSGFRSVVGARTQAAVAGRVSHLRPVPRVSARDHVATELERIGTVVTAVRGKTVIEEGETVEHVFKVVAGALRAVRLLPDGRRYITKFLLPGDYFGFTEGGHYDQTVEVVGDATFIRYSRSSFDSLLARDAAAGRRFFGVICGELCAAQERLLLLGRKCARERLATFLLGMADRTVPGEAASPNEIHLPMNRADVADYLGLTVETVSRLLTQMRNDRVIDLPTPNHVLFVKREALEAISSGEQ